MKPLDLAAPVTGNLELGGGHFLTTLRAPEIASVVRPGQFVMLGTTDPNELLLRRPFSVCLTRSSAAGSSRDELIETGAAIRSHDEIQLLYKVVGRGTALFSTLGAGAKLAVLGPLGNRFTIPPDDVEPVLIAGGIGIAAFPSFVEELRSLGRDPLLIYGARTAGDLPMLDWLRERCRVITVTEDGSEGDTGLVTGPLERILGERGRAGGLRLYSCGPEPMIAAVAEIAERTDLPSEAALEAYMACGFGVCLGCVVEARESAGEYGRYRRVCVEGPIFQTREIRW